MIKSSAKITGLGAYVPQKRLTNHDLEKMVDTNDEWIVKRTGVKERRISEKNEYSSDMAIKAVENLIESCKVDISDVDMIIVTTFTPDHMAPSVASVVQGRFGMKNAGTMDINSGCTGYIHGLCTANALITCGNNNKILVIASETVSKVVDYTDRNTCILFGDGAAAMLVEKTSGNGSFIASYFATDGTLAENVTCSNLSDCINGKQLPKSRLFDQEGRFLYEYVVKNIPPAILALLQNNNLSVLDINWFIPHSANLKMIEGICKRLGYPMSKTLISNEYFGNTSSVSIPLAIWLAAKEGKINPGDRLLLYGFGAGLTHGGLILEW